MEPTFGTYLRIRLGIDIAKYNSPLNSTGGGAFRGHKLKSGKAAKRMDRLTPNWNTSVDSSGNGHRLAPRYHAAAFGGGGGGLGINNSKSWEMWSNSWTDWEYILHIIYNAGESGNGHRSNKLAS